MANIRQRPNGKFEVRDKKHSKVVDTYAEAKKIKTALEAGAALPQKDTVAATTLGDYARDVWLPRSGLSAGSKRAMASALNQLPGLAARSLAWVATHRREVYDEISKSSRVDHGALYMAVKRCCDFAVDEQVLGSHSLHKLNVQRSYARRDYIPTTLQQRQFIADGLGKRGLALWILSGCGLRYGECVALHGSDFREAFTVLRVSRNADRGKAGPLKCRKLGQSRDVPVPPWLSQMVRSYVSANGLGPLFPGARGKDYVSYNCIGARISRLAAEVGLTGFTPHNFRHDYVTKQLDQTHGDVAKVAMWSGDDVETVMLYAHMTASAMEAGRNIAQ